MTPAINLLKQQRINHRLHTYNHDPGSASYGLEAAEKLAVAPARVFKTLVVSLDTGKLVVGVIPVSALLNLKQLARAAGARKASMADKLLVERSSGYVLGGVSPLGQKKPLPTYIDDSARSHATIYVSAGRRGLELELTATDLGALTAARFAPLCQ